MTIYGTQFIFPLCREITFSPTQGDEGLKPAVEALQEKVKDLAPTIAQSEVPDSPLLSVPAPTAI